MPFEFIDHRHCEILHRNMALALRVAEELIGAEPKAPRARARSEVRRRRKKGPVKIGLGSESFEKTPTATQRSTGLWRQDPSRRDLLSKG
jgi:hypothetical protein